MPNFCTHTTLKEPAVNANELLSFQCTVCPDFEPIVTYFSTTPTTAKVSGWSWQLVTAIPDEVMMVR
jgi:hypothetical protein